MAGSALPCRRNPARSATLRFLDAHREIPRRRSGQVWRSQELLLLLHSQPYVAVTSRRNFNRTSETPLTFVGIRESSQRSARRLTDSQPFTSRQVCLPYRGRLHPRYLPDFVLYSTHEPCAMCAGACVWSKGRWYLVCPKKTSLPTVRDTVPRNSNGAPVSSHANSSLKRAIFTFPSSKVF